MKFKIAAWSILLVSIIGLVSITLLAYIFIDFVDSLSTTGAILIFIVIMAFAFVHDNKTKKKDKEANTIFLKIAHYITAKDVDEFDVFYNLYFKHKKDFIAKNSLLINEYKNLNFKNLKPIELLYIFLASKKLIGVTDWTGEENEYEIEEFITANIQVSTWQNSLKFRNNPANKKLNNSEFTIRLLKAIDKDLQAADQRLIFLDLGWDAYVYTCIDKMNFKAVMQHQFTNFYGAVKLS